MEPPRTRYASGGDVNIASLPKTSTGKIQKFVLREKAKSASAIE